MNKEAQEKLKDLLVGICCDATLGEVFNKETKITADIAVKFAEWLKQSPHSFGHATNTQAQFDYFILNIYQQ